MTRTRPIILEGPDGSGKSTLLNQLGRAFPGRTMIHTGGSNKTREALLEKMHQIEKQSLLPNGVIFDRVPFISDSIYKEALGEEALLPEHFLTTELVDLQPLLIFVRLDTVEEMTRNILDVPKPHKPPGYLQRVFEAYPKIVEGYDRRFAILQELLPVYFYNWHHNLPEDVVAWVKEREEA